MNTYWVKIIWEDGFTVDRCCNSSSMIMAIAETAIKWSEGIDSKITFVQAQILKEA